MTTTDALEQGDTHPGPRLDPRKREVVDTDRAFTPPLTNDELLAIYDCGMRMVRASQTCNESRPMLKLLAILITLTVVPPAYAANILTIDGDSMVDSINGATGLTTNLKALLGSAWQVNDFAVGGATITGANSLTAREARVNKTYSPKHSVRDELLVWIGTNDGCNENDGGNTATAEAQTYLKAMLKKGWKITWIAMLPRDAPWCPQDMDQFRSNYNALMFTWTQANGVRFLNPVSLNPSLGFPDDIDYYIDGTHPTSLTESIIAKQIINLIGQASTLAKLD